MSYEYNGFGKNSEQILNSLINVDLHIHSIFSKYKEGTIKRDDGTEVGIVDASDFEHIDVLLKKLDNNNINLFAFTDHNRFSQDLYEKTCEIIETSGKYNNIKCLLPGVEFDVQIEKGKKSCHIITIFDARNHDDLVRIEASINNNQLKSETDFYELTAFEMLMKNIGLNTIFIACQRKDMDNPKGGANCISDSVSDIYEFLKVGFINALEYQKSNVEGMLLNNLKDFPRNMGLVCGSDCHQWEVYPLHDETDKNINIKRFFTIKSLPTYLGLLLALTSPETRFRRSCEAKEYFDGFEYGDNKIPLSDGINVIIGENGSGKSTLLSAIGNEKLAPYQKKLLQQNKVAVGNNGINKRYVPQNYIINQTKNSKQLFPDALFSELDNSAFEKAIKDYSNDLMKYVSTCINLTNALADLKKKKLVINPELYYSKTYYIDVNITDFKTLDIIDLYKEHLSSFNGIINSLKNEFESIGIYSDEEIENMKKTYNELIVIRNSLAIKYKKIYLKNHVINVVLEKVKEYKKEIKNSSTEDDVNSTAYKSSVQEFISNCGDYLNSGILTKYSFPVLSLDLVNSNYGLSENMDKGYKFYKKTKYYKNADILEDFYKSVFNAEFRSDDKIKSISTEELFAEAITSANISNYKEVYKERVQKFLVDEEKFTFEVLEATSQKKMGNTLGEKSLVYYKYITFEEKNGFKILYIDQPEDNISNIRIASELISYLNNLRNSKQIIFVTHNPLLVINLDVDNVIILENKGGNISIHNGCLEHKDNLNRIAMLLDGGKELIEKRLKLYYGREKN